MQVWRERELADVKAKKDPTTLSKSTASNKKQIKRHSVMNNLIS